MPASLHIATVTARIHPWRQVRLVVHETSVMSVLARPAHFAKQGLTPRLPLEYRRPILSDQSPVRASTYATV